VTASSAEPVRMRSLRMSFLPIGQIERNLQRVVELPG
jgi:hypothetical protein